MSRILGIDLGTANACAAVFHEGTVHVVPNAEGSRITPSVCAYQPSDGTWLVGHTAQRQAAGNLQNTVYAPLRLLGRRFDSEEIRRFAEGATFPIEEAEGGSVAVRIAGRTYTPVELCSLVLIALKRAAENYLGESIERTALCVPESFTRRQRDDLRDAAAIAGLTVVRMINAATAAGLAYGFFNRSAERVAVYDLGGGTFDVSILALGDGIVETLATEGDGALGGDKIDWMIARWLAEELEEEYGIDLTSNSRDFRRLLNASENAKCALSTLTATHVFLPLPEASDETPKHLNRVLTREQLDQMIAPLLDRTIEPCERALSRTGLSATQLDAVVPVGGQTRTPFVLETIHEIFGRDVRHRLNPDEAPAIGAAIRAAVAQGEVASLVLDGISHSLSCEINDGVRIPVLEKDAPLPTKKIVVLSLDFAQGLRLLEGDRRDDSVSLGHLDPSHDAWSTSRQLDVEITFEVDIEDNLLVTAQEAGSRDNSANVLTCSTCLTKHDIERSRRNLRFQEDPETVRTQRLRSLSRLRDLHGKVRDLYEALAPALPQRERARIEASLADTHRAEECGIDEIREAHRWLSVSFEILEATALSALPMEERVRLAFPGGSVEDFASSRSESPEALRAVALNPEWAARYGVRYGLVTNPATPIDIAMRFVDGLWDEDLKEVSRSETLPEMLRSHAKTILRMRLPPGPSLSQPS